VEDAFIVQATHVKPHVGKICCSVGTITLPSSGLLLVTIFFSFFFLSYTPKSIY
jgi:hypothetical protein